MYNQCPYRWKLNYIDKLKISESNIYLIFGTAMHEVLQYYLEVMYNESAKKADELDLNIMLRDKLIEQFKIANENDGKPPCTKEELDEFFQDGILIIDFIKKRRNEYFRKRDYELIGCEVPIDIKLKNNVKMIGYLDLVLKHIPTNSIKIIDIKTSTMGWNKWQKKDVNKTSQLLLYKKFYSMMYDHPIDRIDIEYFIVKRKLWEKAMYPQKRVQKFVPANGTPSINKVSRRLDIFLNEAFTDSGEHKNDMVATPSKKSCRFCEFNQSEYCSQGVR